MLALLVRMQTLFVVGYDRLTSEDEGASLVKELRDHVTHEIGPIVPPHPPSTTDGGASAG